MNTPRDHHESNRYGMVRAARIYSNVVSPPVMFAVLGLAVALHELPFWNALSWAVIYGFFASLAPILVVLYLLKIGRITELHMSNTSERHLPYVTAILFSAVAYGIISLGNGPELLRCLTMFNLIELAALGIINIFWLISIHATGIMATTVIIGLVFGWMPAAVIGLPLVISVAAVRLYLRRHTLLQVAAGLALGVLSVYSLKLISCF